MHFALCRRSLLIEDWSLCVSKSTQFKVYQLIQDALLWVQKEVQYRAWVWHWHYDSHSTCQTDCWRETDGPRGLYSQFLRGQPLMIVGGGIGQKFWSDFFPSQLGTCFFPKQVGISPFLWCWGASSFFPWCQHRFLFSILPNNPPPPRWLMVHPLVT